MRHAIKPVKVFLLLLTVLLSACGGGSGTDPDVVVSSGFVPRFAPGDGILPFPINLLFSGSLDGTLNIPNPGAANSAITAVNALDGFSTVAPLSVSFSAQIDPATLNGNSVRLYEVTLDGIGGSVTSVTRRLAFGTEYTAVVSSVDPGGTSLAILPLQPLAPATSYLAVITRSVSDVDGNIALPDTQYVLAQGSAELTGALAGLEPIRQQVNTQEDMLAGQGLPSNNIALSWTFTTQSVGVVLNTVRSLAAMSPITSAINSTSIGNTTLVGGAGLADIFVGTVNIPYYLETAAGANDPTPLASSWTAANAVGGENNLTALNPLPVQRSVETVPLLVTVPAGAPGPYPVVIVQHGITSNRLAMLGAADALAAAGFASVAIDLPLHGVTDNASPFFQMGNERTFDLDLVNNTTMAPGPDGNTDPSGTHFIQLASLLTSRDNLREGEADLFALRIALNDMDINGDSNPDFIIDGANPVRFLGHSLGGMVGSAFLALEADVGAATLAMPGGGIAKLLDGSETFGPVIAAGLAAAAGISRGTPEFEQFLGLAQAAADSGDPINYPAATEGRGVLMFEVVGGNSSLPDQVIPNNVLTDAPVGVVPGVGGTEPLASAQGLTQVGQDTSGSNLALLVQFNAGNHGSIFTPAPDALSAMVFTEMQSQMVTFLATNGSTLDVTDDTLVEQP